MEPSAMFERVLGTGEHLRWSGRAHNLPLAFWLFGPLVMVAVPVFAVLPTQFSAHPRAFHLNTDFPLLILPAVGLLFGVVNVRVWSEAAKTAYGVTNRRLLWARGTTVRAVNLWSIANVTLARGGSRRAASWIEFRPPGDEGAPRPSALAWQSLETGTLDRPDRKNWSVESPEKVAALIREVMESGQAGGTTPQVQYDRSYQAER
jgi:hypothetical protein